MPVSLQLNAGTTGAYTCVCNTQQGYTVRVNSYTCGTTSPSAAPTTTPTSSPTGNPCAPGQNNSCHAPSTFCSNRINSGRPIVGGVGAGQYVCECAVSRGFTIPLSGYECGTSAPTTAAPTSTPTTPPPTDAAASSGPLGSVGGGGGGFSVIIIIAIAIVIAALIIGFALYKRKANDGGGASDSSRVQFENPMYEDNTATAEDYSEMNGAEETGGYMDVGDESKSGYLDVEGANDAEDLYDESAEKYDSDEDM